MSSTCAGFKAGAVQGTEQERAETGVGYWQGRAGLMAGTVQGHDMAGQDRALVGPGSGQDRTGKGRAMPDRTGAGPDCEGQGSAGHCKVWIGKARAG